VISEPERSAASITTTPREIPEISRLRRGKSLPRGEKPGERSLIKRPRSPIALQLFILGRIDDVVPRARPEAMTKPLSASSVAIRRVNFCPIAEPLRAPTMATMGILARSSLPLA